MPGGGDVRVYFYTRVYSSCCVHHNVLFVYVVFKLTDKLVHNTSVGASPHLHPAKSEARTHFQNASLLHTPLPCYKTPTNVSLVAIDPTTACCNVTQKHRLMWKEQQVPWVCRRLSDYWLSFWLSPSQPVSLSIYLCMYVFLVSPSQCNDERATWTSILKF